MSPLAKTMYKWSSRPNKGFDNRYICLVSTKIVMVIIVEMTPIEQNRSVDIYARVAIHCLINSINRSVPRCGNREHLRYSYVTERGSTPDVYRSRGRRIICQGIPFCGPSTDIRWDGCPGLSVQIEWVCVYFIVRRISNIDRVSTIPL